MANITNIEQLKETIVTSLGDLGTKIGDDPLTFAAEQALDETGFSFPLTSGSIKYWGIQRGKRHALDILRATASYKFKYKQISLNQRFDHLDKMIERMDEAWHKALETDPVLIAANVDVSKIFGTYVGNGFIYDQYGRDWTRVMKDLGEDNEDYRYVQTSGY